MGLAEMALEFVAPIWCFVIAAADTTTNGTWEDLGPGVFPHVAS